LHVDGNAYFLRAVECGAEAKTAEFILEKVKESINLANDKYGCQVKSVVTDNARNMEKMRRLLHEENNSIFVYGCSSHNLNLLGQSLTPESIMKNVIEVQKYFRNHHAPSGWLQELEGSVKPQLPGDTRWNSQMDCMSSFLRNRQSYQVIVKDHEDEINAHVAEIINDYNLYKDVTDVVQMLDPVSQALDKLQGEKANVSEACHTWLGLIEEESLQACKSIVSTRMNKALKPFHFFAYLMDHKYRGKRLSPEQREIAREWLKNIQVENFPFVIAFEAEASPYPATYFSAAAVTMHPVIWWNAVAKSSSIPSNFVAIITQLLSSPASSASIERVFSSFSGVHSNLRNRLGVVKAAKLVFCYRALRGPMESEY